MKKLICILEIMLYTSLFCAAAIDNGVQSFLGSMSRGVSLPVAIAESIPVPAVAGLVLEYLFGANGSESTITLDTSGNNYTGTVHGATWSVYTNGIIHAYDFAGASTTNSIDAGNNYAMETNRMTFSMWIKPDSYSSFDMIMASKESATKYVQWGLGNVSGELNWWSRWTGYNAADKKVTGVIDIGAWNHVVFWYDGSQVGNDSKFYIDGSEALAFDGSVASEGGAYDVSAPIFIGSSVDVASRSFDGQIWGVQILSTNLTASEILATNRYQAVQLGIASKASYDLGLDPVFDMTSNGNGATPQDGSTNASTVTATALAGYPMGYTNEGTVYNGSTSVAKSDDAPFPSGSEARTVAMWIKHDQANRNETFYQYGKWAAGTNEYFIMYYNTNTYYNFSMGSTGLRFTNMVDTFWHHVAWVCPSGATASGMSIYWDGVLQTDNVGLIDAAKDWAFNTQLSGTNYIGSDEFGNFFDGNIDEVKLYNSALTTGNIATLYTNESTMLGNIPNIWTNSWYSDLFYLATYNALDNKDWSGMGRNGYNGTATDAVYTGGFLTLNGSTTRDILPSTYPLNGSSAFTFAAWVKFNNIANVDTLVGIRGGTSKDLLFRMSGTNEVSCYFDGSGASSVTATSSGASLLHDTWYHLAAVYDSAVGLKLYVNGVENGTAGTQGNVGQTTPINIGRDPNNSRYIDGFMDTVMLSATAFSSNNIAYIANTNNIPRGGQ